MSGSMASARSMSSRRLRHPHVAVGVHVAEVVEDRAPTAARRPAPRGRRPPRRRGASGARGRRRAGRGRGGSAGRCARASRSVASAAGYSSARRWKSATWASTAASRGACLPQRLDERAAALRGRRAARRTLASRASRSRSVGVLRARLAHRGQRGVVVLGQQQRVDLLARAARGRARRWRPRAGRRRRTRGGGRAAGRPCPRWTRNTRSLPAPSASPLRLRARIFSMSATAAVKSRRASATVTRQVRRLQVGGIGLQQAVDGGGRLVELRGSRGRRGPAGRGRSGSARRRRGSASASARASAIAPGAEEQVAQRHAHARGSAARARAPCGS